MKKVVILLISVVFILAIIGFNKSIDNDDSFKLQMENKNFEFYSYNKDKKCLADLSKILEENYNRISKELNITLKEKVIIEVYPDIKAFHDAMGSPNAPNWVVGTGWKNKIEMVSPLNPGGQHTYDTLMQVVVHEFTHVVISNINSDLESIPIWLNEGIAAYEAKQMSSNSRSAIKEKLDSNDVPSLSEMNSSNFSEVGGYVFSYTAIEYLIENYGYDTIVLLIKTPTDLEKILGNSMMEFENSWKNHLKENYE